MGLRGEFLGMFPLILTVLTRDYTGGGGYYNPH